MSKEKEDQIKNAHEYGYLGNEIIPVKVTEYWKLKELVDEILLDETQPMFAEKYMYVHRDTGKRIDKVTEQNKSVAVKIVNVQGTLESAPTVYRTARGMKLLEMKLAMNQLHLDMIKSGVAKHMPTLQAQFEADKANLSTVENSPEELSQEAPIDTGRESLLNVVRDEPQEDGVFTLKTDEDDSPEPTQA